MEKLHIRAKSKKVDREVEFDVDFPTTLAEAVTVFTEATVFDVFKTECKTRYENAARVALQGQKPAEEAIKIGQEYKIGVRRAASPGGKRGNPVAELANRVKQGKVSLADLITALKAELQK